MRKSYPITVRRATPADAARIGDLSCRVMTETFVGEFGIAYVPAELDVFLEAKHGPAAMARYLADPTVAIWVCEVEGRLAGYALCGDMSLPHPEAQADDGELHRLYVDKAFHGQGAAKALMDAAMVWMEDRRAQWLGVWSGNIRAQKFYGRYGFEKVGEYDYIVGSTKDHEFIFRRRLG
jgi:ribosomal protein S18 acetylase RimI-like enzyme